MENGCQMKYLSYSKSSEKLETMKCTKGEKGRIWEDNISLLVED
jgi:hypothetical protein